MTEDKQNEPVVKEKMDAVSWLECPYCKKKILAGQPEVVGALKEWREQNIPNE